MPSLRAAGAGGRPWWRTRGAGWPCVALPVRASLDTGDHVPHLDDGFLRNEEADGPRRWRGDLRSSLVDLHLCDELVFLHGVAAPDEPGGHNALRARPLVSDGRERDIGHAFTTRWMASSMRFWVGSTAYSSDRA